MGDHWALKYLGQPYTEEMDCWWWFRRIQADRFGRDVERLDRLYGGKNFLLTVAKFMGSEMEVRKIGWRPTDEPREGDAVFLAQRTRAHHIGTVIEIGELGVVHALEEIGVVISRMIHLRALGWRTLGYWTCE